MASTPSLTTASIIAELQDRFGGAVKPELFTKLSRAALRTAVNEAPYYNVREHTWQDVTGDGVSCRFELTGRQIILLNNSLQRKPQHVDGYETFTRYQPDTDNLEPGVGADGLADPLVTTLSFAIIIPSPTKVRVWMTRQAEMPALDTAVIPLDDTYLMKATRMHMHVAVGPRVISGDATNHAYQADSLMKELQTLKRLRPQPRRGNRGAWRGNG